MWWRPWVSVRNWRREQCGSVWAGLRRRQTLIPSLRLGESSPIPYLECEETRLEAYRRWLTMTEPTWARVNYPKIDYQDLYYYSAPKPKKQLSSIDEIDPEILKTYEKLGIPLREVAVLEGVVKPVAAEGEEGAPARSRIAVDAVFDSVSV